MPTTRIAPDLTVYCKSTALAKALVTVLTEGLETNLEEEDGERRYASSNQRVLTVPWAGTALYAREIAEVVIKTGAATEREAQAMLDRAAAWDLDEPIEKVIKMREQLDRELAERTPSEEPDIAAVLARMIEAGPFPGSVSFG